MKIFNFHLFAKLILIGIVFASMPLSLHAVEDIEIVGLFGKQVVLKVDGRQHILKEGQRSPEGVKLITASAKEAVLEIDGEQQSYPIGRSAVGTTYKKRKRETVNVYKDTRGMYRTVGSINGFPVKFLVDTGASSVAMSTKEASRLGIDYQSGERIMISTASQVVPGYRFKINSVTVGDIKLYNVEGTAVDGGPEVVLLGMSFLGRMKVEYQGTLMRITPAY